MFATDRAVFATSYAARLRRAGLPVSLTSVERCAESLDAVGALSLADVYWVLRLSFVTRRSDVMAFDAVFEAVFDVLPHPEMGFVSPNAASRAAPDRPDRDDEQLVGVQRAPDDVASLASALPWATLPAFGDDGLDVTIDKLLANRRRNASERKAVGSVSV